ncbi:amino acid aminotransferase [Tepidiphilus thermophilus]|uniref:Aminotransferase n=1 Tax=Tepidiphilus thermophilus TaxID=876478 RepID=A0A0K6IX30_9PROT|nr:amino acid aminotransferase [Tepidiphilus thermophilus]CUB07902.1 Aspartate/tyrosine/aromatic aminotransferase [Tepidiphilus thermophilus]
MSRSLFAAVELAPRDPILGLNEAFAADPRPQKVNLGVGVYYDEEGRIPLLASVKTAEEARVRQAKPRGYQPIEGPAAYTGAVQRLLFGADSPLLAEGRVVTAQGLGGTGALRIGGDLLRRIVPEATVYISDPSWENHRGIFEAAGFPVRTYRYYDPATGGVDFAGMKAALAAMAPRSIVVLHACCHNPTGADLTEAQWQEVAQTCVAGELVPFLDMAYQGFAEGIDADAAAVHHFLAAGIPFFVSSSFSKNFSLYGERVGALSIVTGSRDEAERVLSQLKRVIRTNYSNPPTHGAALVADVLASGELRAQWEEELGGMRRRIRAMREGLRQRLEAAVPGKDFSFVTEQRGMFSYTGLTPEQVERLKSEYGIYAVRSGRICIAALNARNLDYVAEAIAAVLRG